MLLTTGAVPEGDGWALEVKWDGCRAQLRYDGRSVSLRTRHGRECAEDFPELAEIAGVLGVAADAAEAILNWADREPRLEVRYTHRSSVRLWSAGGRLLQIDRGGRLRLVLLTLSEHGEPWDDERIEQLVQELAEIGVQLEPKRTWPKTPLEPLADDTTRRQFLTLMERVLDALATSP
jgi:hypothetical protein